MRRLEILAGLAAGLAGAGAAAAQTPGPPQPPPQVPAVEITPARVELDREGSLSTDVVFEVGEAGFRPAAAPVLDAIARALVKDQSTRLTIDVFTDDTAPDSDRSGEFLMKLSQRRAEAIKAHLVKRGVAGRRLTAIGHGSTAPLASNQSEDGRRANRRIELNFEIEIRPPVAADLATYTRQLRGAGPRLNATIATSEGTLRCELFGDKAPMTVANFIGLATGQKSWLDPVTGKVMRGKPFYDGLTFHRVIPRFMIQGGDPQGIGVGGPGYKFADEIVPELTHQAGTLAMANAGPDTNGSQFFINEVETAWLNSKYTVFGKCKEVDVVIRIGSAPRGRNDMPNTPIKITKITITRSP